MSALRRILTPYIQALFEKHPIVPTLIFFCASIFFAVCIYNGWQTLNRYSDAAMPMAFSPASALSKESPIYVSLPNMQWKCGDKFQYKNSHSMIIPLIDQSGKNLVIFDPPTQDRTCENMQYDNPIGVLEPIASRYYLHLGKEGFDFINNFEKDNVWTLCGGCGPEDSKLGIKICTGCLLFCLVFTVFFGLRYLRQ